MTINRNSWSEKEEQILFETLEKNKDYVLTYSFEQTALRLNRSLSAVRQHYYYHHNKIKKKSLRKEFSNLIKNGDFKIIKHKNLFIVL